jgi:hypothetical protein
MRTSLSAQQAGAGPWPRAALYGVASLALADALVHALVVPEHLREEPLYGVFFALLAGFQLVYGLLILRSPSAPLMVLGAGWASGLLVLYLVSVTTGLLPEAAHSGHGEEIQPIATWG